LSRSRNRGAPGGLREDRSVHQRVRQMRLVRDCRRSGCPDSAVTSSERFVGERLLIRAENAVDGGTNPGRSSLRSRDGRRVADSTAPTPSEGPPAGFRVLSVGAIRCVRGRLLLLIPVVIVVVERAVSSLRSIFIIVGYSSIGPAFDVLAERPEEVRSELPDNASVLRSSPRRYPQDRADECAKEEEYGSENEGPEEVGGAKVMKSGGGRRRVKSGDGVTSDGAVLLVESGLPDRKTERMLDVDGLWTKSSPSVRERGEEREEQRTSCRSFNVYSTSSPSSLSLPPACVPSAPPSRQSSRRGS
jgi:hypothetical protein